MKCPFCGFIDNKVIDSRLGKDKNVIRRRRECNECGRRFTTYERIEEVLPLVIKRDGRREPFDRMKILAGLRKAAQKRPISQNALERIVDRVETAIQETGEKEIKSTVIGEMIMNELYELDGVAYVRFASVYRSFKDVEEFLREVVKLQEAREKKKTSQQE
jgi:transcriptional repressor NrdR